MSPGPSLAVSAVDELLALDGHPRPARSLLVEIILAKEWATDLAAFELAEKWEAAFLRRLRSKLSAARENGWFIRFDFNSSSDDLIQGACFEEPGDSDSLKESKRRRLLHSDYFSALSGVTPSQFEAVCRGVLRLMGVERPALTPYTADEGIDFYGRLRLVDVDSNERGLPGFRDVLTVWLVGQAKHYPDGKAATPEIRELVGSVVLARAGAFSRVRSAYGDLEIRACDPVFYLFFTTGAISTAGWRLLRSSGAVGMDGPMLAAFLADRGVGLAESAFDSVVFIEWIASQ